MFLGVAGGAEGHSIDQVEPPFRSILPGCDMVGMQRSPMPALAASVLIPSKHRSTPRCRLRSMPLILSPSSESSFLWTHDDSTLMTKPVLGFFITFLRSPSHNGQNPPAGKSTFG